MTRNAINVDDITTAWISSGSAPAIDGEGGRLPRRP